MTSILANRAYISKEGLDPKWLERYREVLIARPEDAYNQREDFQLYAEDEDFFSGPRAWGRYVLELNKWKYVDQTVQKFLRWPKLKLESYRPGQEKAIEALVRGLDKEYGGRLDAATSSGKTLMAIITASRLQQKTLVLLHKEDLAEVWHKNAKQFFPGIKLGHIQQDKWDYNAHVTTALYQTIYSRREELPKNFRNAFGMIITDEAHRVAAPTFCTVLDMFSARYRLGVSATWARKDGLSHLFEWFIGSVLHRMTAPQLTCKYKVVNFPVRVRDADFSYRGNLNTSRMLTHVSQIAPLNDYIAEQALRAVQVGRKVLILSDRLKQVEALKRRLGDAAAKYVGGTSKDGRAKATKANIIIGTYKAVGEGSDIADLDTLILASPKSDIVQAVGRIRRPHPTKKKPIILDIVVSGSRYMQALAYKRQQQYQMLGFEEIG